MKKPNTVDLFLDSGAFSAKNQGININIEEYIAFIKEHEHLLTVYANLDVIGSAEETWKNQMTMEKAGLKPLPTFHYGEALKWLNRYIDRGYDYIALGGMVKTPNLIPWLDDIWFRFLTDEQGFPKIKVHGFGMTSLSLMLRYPWYSVDSTSWVVTGRLGSIYVPCHKGGRWIYDEQSIKLSVSSQSPDIKDAGQHYTTLSPLHRQLVDMYLKEKGYAMGESAFRMEPQDYQLLENERWAQKKPTDKKEHRRVEQILIPGVSNKYQLRDEINIQYFLDLEKNMPEWPWKFKFQSQKRLF